MHQRGVPLHAAVTASGQFSCQCAFTSWRRCPTGVLITSSVHIWAVCHTHRKTRPLYRSGEQQGWDICCGAQLRHHYITRCCHQVSRHKQEDNSDCDPLGMQTRVMAWYARTPRDKLDIQSPSDALTCWSSLWLLTQAEVSETRGWMCGTNST